MSDKIQVVICKCGSMIAGCWEPHCYTEKSWMKSVRKYAKKGYEIKLVDRVKLQKCTCD